MSGEPLPVVGLHHVKLPMPDLARSRAWYETLLRLEVEIEFPDAEGIVRGVAYQPLAGLRIALREEPARAAALAGWDPIALAVESRADLDTVARRLDELGIEHGPVVQATLGWLIVAEAPDQQQLRFYTLERHD